MWNQYIYPGLIPMADMSEKMIVCIIVTLHTHLFNPNKHLMEQTDWGRGLLELQLSWVNCLQLQSLLALEQRSSFSKILCEYRCLDICGTKIRNHLSYITSALYLWFISWDKLTTAFKIMSKFCLVFRITFSAHWGESQIVL